MTSNFDIKIQHLKYTKRVHRLPKVIKPYKTKTSISIVLQFSKWFIRRVPRWLTERRLEEQHLHSLGNKLPWCEESALPGRYCSLEEQAATAMSQKNEKWWQHERVLWQRRRPRVVSRVLDYTLIMDFHVPLGRMTELLCICNRQSHYHE